MKYLPKLLVFAVLVMSTCIFSEELHLVSIKCIETEDFTGADDAYIVINGNTVWQRKMNNGQQRSINIAPIKFSKSITVELYDEDSGPWDDDDCLGSQIVRDSAKGMEDPLELHYTEDGANYIIYYKVK
ncbi:hypothetical protein [Candidatus Uabimicrobium amorphum]|uniref:Uncharacterized protein n=1 Tax=Uabimicrobium amorphum TaxID=2596890 RepID=A0A5S9F6T3_UABAM|nr:hypothetical protein [Candidatus Uabimicrobium amorphum]BBM86592.1 hypothetical protein UABAM_04978 [Candidatus Uabimicrobium amorphum]